jgi:hypothetical protein
MAFSFGACKSTGQINRAKRDLECIPPCPQGPCQPYVGSLCSKYIGQEYVFVPQGLSQEYIEEKVNETFTAISPSDSCAPYSNKALCMTALPLCNKKTQEPKLICKDDCELLENQLCRQELKEIHGRALLGLLAVFLADT